ncbi:quaternary amine ABC transporter ATP-binding protein [Saccharospirillum impatiens]|uniref:quaternary amine ABC transporter ATP-binding protein n=1 Tax=Saccharospirillum impatiens TaxID=169438 RepID=UPI0003F5FD9D|nr:glycine betaine/L-proline ABC transporter ATP-binding protein [Saccharospirillum impatiens]
MAKIEISGIYKIFGPNPKRHLQAVTKGLSKDSLLADTGHTLGLQDVNLSIEEGELFVIMGLSGSGKSTLIRHINRLIDPTSGSIRIDGENVLNLRQNELIQLRRHKMSMVFQRFALFPHKTVLDNVAYGLTVQGIDKKNARVIAADWLEQVGLQGFGDQHPHELSGGMQQRVGLARALATNPDILLMDEAFSALDPLIRKEMQDLLMKLQQQLHKTIVFITHDLDEALRLGNRIAILKDGALVQQGDPQDILLAPQDDYVADFVKDVNRGKVLNAHHVLAKPVSTLTTQTSVTKAREWIMRHGFDYATVLEGPYLKGIVTLNALQSATEDTIRERVSPVSSVLESADLESLMPRMIRDTAPIAVTTDNGEFVGWVSRTKVIRLISPAQPIGQQDPVGELTE